MIPALDAVTALGPAMFRVVYPGAPGAVAADVHVADPADDAVGARGDLVLGVGASSTADAVALVAACGAVGAAGLVLRGDLAGEPDVATAAQRDGLLVVGLADGVTWAHVVWLLRGVVDRAAAPASPAAGDAGVHNDLFTLADAAAAIVDAPVTIEDNQSRVLAYSSEQTAADTARVSTIVGRRVPAELVAHFRARGVFRRLARSSEPFLVPEGPDGTKPRLVVPVRAGGEWLGSIWAVVDGLVPDQVVDELRGAASVVALHLLRIRAQADVARRTTVDRVRALLRTGDALPGDAALLGAGPWRVAVLGAGPGEDDVEERLDAWDSSLRRRGWSRPLLADVDEQVCAVVTEEPSGAGSRRWLAGLLPALREDVGDLVVGMSGPARGLDVLPAARVGAVEALEVARARGEPLLTYDEAWAAVVVHRAERAVAGTTVGPVPVLLAHDDEHGTAHAATLAAWLRHPGEPLQVARELHVHVNTVRHRMRRIHELVDLDLADPEVRLAVALQLRAVTPGSTPPSR